MKPFFSIIIPIRLENDYLYQTQKKLKKQTYKNFELLIITDKISHSPNPANKRNLGAKKSNGKYLIFLDDDSYPEKNWLKNIKKQIDLHPNYTAFCGPALTPPNNTIFQKASGLVWSSWLGSGGAGTYRSKAMSPRFVDDYPTVNLIVKRSDFIKVGGFNPGYWPGEDTILCLKLTKNLHKKIYYHPSIVVFHHRRPILIPHLKQISRYALHRGHFAKIFPQTSLKIGYLIPSMFFVYLVSLPFTKILLPLYLYLGLLFITLLNFLLQKNNIFASFLASLTIPITHAYYGFLFLVGLLKKDVNFKAHQINKKTGHYIGG